ncbi:MAG TPA: hypothetical protein VLA24_17055 [Pseudomonadales bacterium]|nr:hypothetical protein [Pseudomonadales bacterium]
MYIPQVQFKSSASGEKIAKGDTVLGVITSIYHIGTQENVYNGRVSQRDTVFVEWELFADRSDGSRFRVGKEMGIVLGSANPKKGQVAFVRRLAEACLGSNINESSFSVWQLLGKCCQVEIGETSSGKMKVANITRLSRGQMQFEPKSEVFAWSILDSNCAVFNDRVPDFLMEKAKQCFELNPEEQATQPPQTSATQAPMLNLDMQTRQALTATDQAKMAAAGFKPQAVNDDDWPEGTPF